MDTCRYVHWILEDPGPQPAGTAERLKQRTRKADKDVGGNVLTNHVSY